MPGVKTPRKYDSRSRKHQAERSRRAILKAARSEFLKVGYAATTIATIARRAAVSVETIYKTFGGKPGLVRALWQLALAGRGSVPAPQRSDQVMAREADPRQIVRAWGKLMAEVAPLVAPLMLLVRTAAASDPSLVGLLDTINAERLARMRHNSRLLGRRGFLRRGVSVAHATDIMWALTSPELYELLVVRRRWSPSRLGSFVVSSLIEALLAA